MSIPYGDHVDLKFNELRHALLHPVTADPAWAAGHGGQVWYRSDLNRISWYDAAGNVHRVRLDAPIGLADLAANSVDGTKIVDGSVGTNEVANAAITQAKLGLTAPTADLHAATKLYVDQMVQGVDWVSTRLATADNLPPNTQGLGAQASVLTANANGALTVDGIAVAVNDRILVKDEPSANKNGLYYVVATGSAGAPWVLERAVEMNQAGEIDGKVVIVEDGTLAGTLWISTSEVVTLNLDPVIFTQFNSATDIIAGKALSRTGNTIDINPGRGLEWENISDTLEVMLAFGGGLNFNVSDELYVTTDDLSVEIGPSGLRVKDGGITADHIAENAVGTSEIAGSAVGTAELQAGSVTNDKLAVSILEHATFTFAPAPGDNVIELGDYRLPRMVTVSYSADAGGGLVQHREVSVGWHVIDNPSGVGATNQLVITFGSVPVVTGLINWHVNYFY